jgi:hypothetical protein
VEVLTACREFRTRRDRLIQVTVLLSVTIDKVPQPIWNQSRGDTPLTLHRRRRSGSVGFVTRSLGKRECATLNDTKSGVVAAEGSERYEVETDVAAARFVASPGV